MEILKITDLEKIDALSLLLAIATDGGKIDLHPIHQKTIQAIGSYIFKVDKKIEELSNSFSIADNFSDENVQKELLHLAAPMVFLEDEGKEQRAQALKDLAQKWHFKDHLINQVFKGAEGHKLALLRCELRPSSVEQGYSPLYQTFYYLTSKLHLNKSHKALFDRYRSYSLLPEGTFGKTLYNYYVDNEFAIPGTPGAEFEDILIIHDIHHVLSGCDTSPLGEICVGAFDAGVSNVDYTAYISALTAQFQIGFTMSDPSINTWVKQFDADMLYRSFRRGIDTKVNYLVKKFDFSPYTSLPISEVRKQFNISEEGMMVTPPNENWAGSYGPPAKRKNPNIVKHGFLQSKF
ncbi:hypothetical protein [Bizionia arctica]|uniref:Uncharacterized protein n=1 Tax=Bizionia arctica TaxID=1495645 RepID=A0A917GKK4_9FLAO|nr:hypothetical protein [Bizionia arctica]GGG49300.1 hypothetical protein GCM10010976_20730 [Bizionia arctica]